MCIIVSFSPIRGWRCLGDDVPPVATGGYSPLPPLGGVTFRTKKYPFLPFMITKTIKKYPKTVLTREQIIELRCQAEKNGVERSNEILRQKRLDDDKIYLQQKNASDKKLTTSK
jgi:hypothetical protein